jgi:hypothetical protein
MLGTITNTVTDNVTVPQLVTGAISAGFTAFVGAMFLGFAGFIWWYVKRKITKSEEAEEERGPVLYKNEHDRDCDTKHEQVMSGLKEVKGSIKTIHKRIDDHLNAEVAGSR